ncbi:ferric reductase NAD binding domain-containing protein [Blastocladiella britannica]|nr:ferric reductase NAD binding domain-containing protein [Blastocladiella britannica]
MPNRTAGKRTSVARPPSSAARRRTRTRTISVHSQRRSDNSSNDAEPESEPPKPLALSSPTLSSHPENALVPDPDVAAADADQSPVEAAMRPKLLPPLTLGRSATLSRRAAGESSPSGHSGRGNARPPRLMHAQSDPSFDAASLPLGMPVPPMPPMPSEGQLPMTLLERRRAKAGGASGAPLTRSLSLRRVATMSRHPDRVAVPTLRRQDSTSSAKAASSAAGQDILARAASLSRAATLSRRGTRKGALPPTLQRFGSAPANAALLSEAGASVGESRVATLQRSGSFNVFARSNSDPLLHAGTPGGAAPTATTGSQFTSTLGRAFTLRRTASPAVASIRSVASASGTTEARALDASEFSALRDIVKEAVTNPSAVLAEAAEADADETASATAVPTSTAASSAHSRGAAVGPLMTSLEPPALSATSLAEVGDDGTDEQDLTECDRPDSATGDATADATATGAVVLTKAQWQQLAPALRGQDSHVHELLGARTLEDDPNLVELDLVTFLPLISLLTAQGSNASTTNNNATCTGVTGEHEQKLAILYRLLDPTGKGDVTVGTLTQILGSAVKANGLYLSPVAMQELVTTVMSVLDVDGDGTVSYYDFMLVTRRWNLAKIGLPLTKSVINESVDITAQDHLSLDMPLSPSTPSSMSHQHPTCGTRRQLRRKSTVRVANKWLINRSSTIQIDLDDHSSGTSSDALEMTASSSKTAPGAAGNATPKLGALAQLGDGSFGPPTARQQWSAYWAAEGTKCLSLGFFFALVGGMAGLNFYTYASNPVVFSKFGYWVPMAKACANIVNVTSMFLFLLVSRTLLTALRDVPVLRAIPINKNIVWHRYCGMMWCVAGVVHSVCHLCKTVPVLLSDAAARQAVGLPAHLTFVDLAFKSVPGWTGWLLLLASVIMVLTSTSKRRKANFERFWYTHHLYISVVILMLLHGSAAMMAPPSSWKFLAVPVAVYAVERLLRLYRASYKLPILQACIQADTLMLVIEKPPFVSHYTAGQYIFLQVPQLSDWQWHPFSLTSCDTDPHLSLRIKKAGDWTGALFKAIEPYCAASSSSTSPPASQTTAPGHHDINMPPPLQVCVDGIFGAPSQTFFEHDHVMFIATGVGCTPFLSLLQQIQVMVRASLAARRMTTVGGGMNQAAAPAAPTIKRVDFFWLNRDQDGFQWMAEALANVDPAVRKLLRVHTFLTCAKGGQELASFLLWWGLELVKKRHSRQLCLLTGLQHSGVFWGRPHWPSLFAQTAALYPHKKVGVFFCGPKVLGKELSSVIRLANASTTTYFEFSKENF